jgi:Fe-S-cluster containining protein
MLRVDPPGSPTNPDEPIDCGARVHLCQAICCHLPWPLSQEEIDAGHAQWDPERPFYISIGPTGSCVHNSEEHHGCTIYDNRPRPCRAYSCKNDRRIWKDFEGMVINAAFVSARRAQPGQVFVDLVPPPGSGLGEPSGSLE